MQYILTEKELQDLVPKNDLMAEKEKVSVLVNVYRNSDECRRARNMGYCDDCPIGSLNNGLSPYVKLCSDQDYSK